MPGKFRYLILTLACSLMLVLCGLSAMANPDPPTWNQLASSTTAAGHVQFSLDPLTRVYTFTVFNDATAVNSQIVGFAVYPETRLNGIVPVADRPTPAGWLATGWQGPVSSLGAAFGNVSYGFEATSPYASIGAGQSKSDFSLRWVGSSVPTKLEFGVLVAKNGTQPAWVKAGCCDGEPPCSPVPDASTLVLFGSGALFALPALRRTRRVRG